MRKQTLILCPGLLNDAALWAHQTAHLGDLADCHVVDTSASARLGDLAEAVLAAAPGQFALAGLSMGGYVAFEVMRRAPERVARLALINTSARPDTPEAKERRLQMIAIAEKGGFDKLPGQILEGQLHPERFADPGLKGAALAMAARVGADGFMRQQQAILGRPDSSTTLAEIACPTLVVGGMQDKLTTPEIMAEIAAGIPGAAFTLIEGAGHLTPIEQPEALTALLRLWLSNHDLAKD